MDDEPQEPRHESNKQDEDKDERQPRRHNLPIQYISFIRVEGIPIARIPTLRLFSQTTGHRLERSGVVVKVLDVEVRETPIDIPDHRVVRTRCILVHKPRDKLGRESQHECIDEHAQACNGGKDVVPDADIFSHVCDGSSIVVYVVVGVHPDFGNVV